MKGLALVVGAGGLGTQLASDLSKDETKAIVVTYSDRSRGTYYYYDIEKDLLTKLADLSPWLNEKDMAFMKPISYKSRDGLTIPGYLTLPLNYKKGNKIQVNKCLFKAKQGISARFA